jgi:hypothetical protein
MAEAATETSTQTATTPVVTSSASSVSSTEAVSSNESEPSSAYDRIIKEYFGELSGEPSETPAAKPENTSAGVERAFTALNTELQTIKAQLSNAGQAPKPVSAETKDEFLDLYARGDKAGARQALIKEMAPSIKAELSRSVSQDVIRATRAEQDIREFSNRLRSENPELVPFEKAISLEARDMVQTAMKQEIVKTVDEYVSASKQALKMTVDAYKKRALALRGEGVTQAQTRTQQVVASSAVQPGQTAITKSSDSNSQEPDVSAKSYLARRREKNMAGRGIGYN